MLAAPDGTIAHRIAAAAFGLGALFASTAGAVDHHVDRWDLLHHSLFPGETIHDGTGVIEVSAPVLADDPAVVPVKVNSLLAQNENRFIATITLLVDQNPVPLAGRFHFTPRSGLAGFSARVRVNEFSFVRAVARMSDGELYMASAFVKAHGGCSAPPLQDPGAAMARLGKMKLRLVGGAQIGKPSLAQLLISHPNHNGMQVDSLSNAYIPARYVREVRVTYGGEPVLRIEGDLSLSEDPRIRFYYVPDRAGELQVKVVDTLDTLFSSRWPVAPEAIN